MNASINSFPKTPGLVNVLMTETDVALRLKLSVKCLQAWRLKGQGPKYLKLGSRGAVRYRAEDLFAWEQSCLKASTSQK